MAVSIQNQLGIVFFLFQPMILWKELNTQCSPIPTRSTAYHIHWLLYLFGPSGDSIFLNSTSNFKKWVLIHNGLSIHQTQVYHFHRLLSSLCPIGNNIYLNWTSDFTKSAQYTMVIFLKNPTRCKVYPFHRLMSLLGKTENGICLRSTSYSIKRAQYIMVLPSYQIHSVSFSLIAVCILSNWEQYLLQFNVWFYKKCSIHNFFFCPTRSTEYRFRRLLSLFGSIGNSSSLRNIPISGRIESWIFQINGQR